MYRDNDFSPACLLSYLAIFILIFAQTSVKADDCVPVGKVLQPSTNSWTTTVELLHANVDKKIVLLGEHHDNMEHHRWQLQMITGLHTLNPEIVLGFEMFPRKAQPILDKWVSGELSEQEFLKQVGWDEYWSFDPSLYMPMFNYARMNAIPIYALNVERSLIKQVGKQGWDKVDVEQKEGVSRPAPASDGYQQMLAGVFMQHGDKHSETSAEELVSKAMAIPGFSRFVESQQVWDRAMAEAISKGVTEHPKAQFVAVLGSGHMMYRFGVPEQLTALKMPSPSVLVPWDLDFECDYIREDFADAVIGLKSSRFSEQQTNSNKPRLGVYLEADEGKVRIGKVVAGSIAEELELQSGDMIFSMAGIEITEVSEVIQTVQATQLGTWLPMTIKRGNKLIELVAKFPPQTETNQHGSK